MLINISLGFVVLIITFLAYVAFQPNDFRYERSAVINAPASVIYGHINDLKLWNDWSPWAKLDPNMKQIFEGPTSGTNSKMFWSGNKDVGEGTMTIVESKPSELVKLSLDYKKPMVATHTSELVLNSEDGSKTKVTWIIYGKNNYVSKIFTILMKTENLVGGYMEQGLNSLKSITEKKAKTE